MFKVCYKKVELYTYYTRNAYFCNILFYIRDVTLENQSFAFAKTMVQSQDSGSNCTADQGRCIRYTDSTISFLYKTKISSFQPASVTVQAGLCRTWLETLKTGFLVSRLIS